MTEREWLQATNSRPMFEFLRGERGEARRREGRRKLRLFACACLRTIWHLLRKPGSRRAVEVAEKFADGLVMEQDLRQAAEDARDALEFSQLGKSPYWQSSEAAIHVAAKLFTNGNHPSVAHASFSTNLALVIESKLVHRRPLDPAIVNRSHADLLRDIIGNPFRPLEVAPAWRSAPVTKLAQAAYDKRELPGGTFDRARLGVLADALEEVGANKAILKHLRDSGPHVRGCWVIDSILGKN